jgi:hypothetical protein
MQLRLDSDGLKPGENPPLHLKIIKQMTLSIYRGMHLLITSANASADINCTSRLKIQPMLLFSLKYNPIPGTIDRFVQKKETILFCQ